MTENKRIECLVFSRIVGYYQPVRQWNKGKQKEWKDRRVYDVSLALKDRADAR